MGKYVIQNGKILLNGFDLSGDHNQIGLTVAREERDVTTFGKAGVQRIAGMQSFEVSGSGFFEAGTGKIDTVVAPNLGTSGAELTILPQGTSVGSKAFIGEINTFEYAPGGSVGDAMGFTFAGRSEGTVLVDGTVLKSGAVSTSGTGTILNLGQIASGRFGYGILHVTATSGNGGTQTLDVKIQSDSTTGFISPTTHISFTQVGNAVASQWKATTATSTTDSYWRARWVSAGVSEGFTFYVSFGISYL